MTNAGDKTEQLEKLSDLYKTVRNKLRRAPTVRSGLFGSGRIELEMPAESRFATYAAEPATAKAASASNLPISAEDGTVQQV